MTEAQRRAREIMTAVVNDDYDLARSLMANALSVGLATQLMETTFQLNRIVLQYWADQNAVSLPEFWQDFSLWMEQQE